MTAGDDTKRRRRLVRLWDLDGLAEIGNAIGRSPRWVQRMAARAEDPLPVSRLNKRIVALAERIRTWLARQTGLPPDTPDDDGSESS